MDEARSQDDLEVHIAQITLLFMCAIAAAASGNLVAPSLNILGSYFPTWMLCALGAVVATALLRQLFVLTGVDRTLPVPVVVYLAITVACSLASWLIWVG